MRAESRLPKLAGVGFKPEHFRQIAAQPQPVGFFEVHAENYMGAGGTPHVELGRIRRDYALSVHGVGLSIGSAGALDSDHLSRLKVLCDRYEPEAVSEHLAWSTMDGMYLSDLLPLPYTEDTLAQVIRHIDAMQSALRRQALIENPATYIQFSDSCISEPEFLDRIAAGTGCGLLLDINNVVVSCRNHGADPWSYLDAFPLHRVGEIHLAGHNRVVDDDGAMLLIDAHGSSVDGEVWALYRRAVAALGPMPTLVEWDNDVPSWPILLSEALLARDVLDGVAKAAA